MESRIERADELHRKGYNCAQAVACTYADLVGVDGARPSAAWRPLAAAWVA